jgi:hypothetical protein
VSGWAPVAHACNASYSGGRDQEDQGLKPVEVNSSQDPVWKKIHHKKKKKKVLVEWLKVYVGCEFKPRTTHTHTKAMSGKQWVLVVILDF